MAFTDLPDDIQATANKINAIQDKWQASVTTDVGYADRSHGDNIRLGKLEAKLRRLCEQYGLKYASVLFAIANKEQRRTWDLH